MYMSTIKIGVSKFRNDNGISCYMNSILHILQQLPSFYNYLISNQNIKEVTFRELAKLFKFSHENDNMNITPASFKNVIGNKNSMWKELEQQDSQEFLIFLISELECELGNKVNFISNTNFKMDNQDSLANNIYGIVAIQKYHENIKNNYSQIKELFIGSTSINLICEFCKTKSPNFEDFITLSVDIPNVIEDLSLNECLKHSFKNEKLDNKNKVHCEFCGLKSKSTKENKLWKSPKILIIHIKRFKFNDYGIQTAKITKKINYPLDLNIDFLFDNLSPNKKNSKYKLLGVNIHEELAYKSIDVGHYVSYVKNIHDNKWYLFNDACEPIKIKKTNLQNKNAYMLFYERMN